MKKIYVKEEVCIGCNLCEVYCRLAHAPSDDIIKALKDKKTPVSRVSVDVRRPVSLSIRCQQCEDSPCVSACLTGALSKDEKTGMVVHDEKKCIGCWTCMLVCPIGAIKQDKTQKKALKCDLCQGKDLPACVTNCPNEALIYIEVPDKNGQGLS
jgi:anaerobic carbon-monoxide dehydrogenase iron sulfur subunit